METLALAALVAASNLACFWLGSRLGRSEAVREAAEAPQKERKPDRMTEYRRKEEEKRQQFEQERDRIILENIESYDGTALGQKNVPGRY